MDDIFINSEIKKYSDQSLFSIIKNIFFYEKHNIHKMISFFALLFYRSHTHWKIYYMTILQLREKV